MVETCSKTCFIDKKNGLFGVLKLKDGFFVDFDRRCILKNNKPVDLSEANYSVLEALILNSPHMLKYEALYDVYYGEDDLSKCSLKTIRNSISVLRKYADIDNLPKKGYRFKTDFKIRKFHDVDGENVPDVAAFLSGFDEPEQALCAKDFSAKFFHAGADAVKDADKPMLWEEADRLSKVLGATATLRDDAGTCIKTDNLLRTLYDLVTTSCADLLPAHLLKITGPLGSYKNRLMQYLYLTIAKCSDGLLPIYMDLAFYDRAAAQNKDVLDVTQEMEKDFEAVRAFVDGHPHLIPVLLLDGVHDFQYNKEVSYNRIGGMLEQMNCKLIICEDTNFTVNSENLFSVHPLSPQDYQYTLQIDSVNLIHRKRSIAFIGACLDLFRLPASYQPERIYDALVRLNFMYIDAYWLRFLITSAGNTMLDQKQTISGLYHMLCLKYLGNPKLLAYAAELAFRYEINPSSIQDTSVFQSRLWQLITKHRSVKDYLIARHYVYKLAHVDYVNGDHDAILRELSFFNMVLPKTITRFVVPMISTVEDYEHKVMIIADKFYDELSVLGKSELTFWLARFSNSKRRKRSIKTLRRFLDKELARYNQDAFDNEADKKDCAFLLRGIQVSLIYENDADALEAYLDSLIFEKTANEINRGFHLEYYGDKPFVPYNTLLDYEDDLSKGENTFSVLCLSLDKVKRSGSAVPFSSLIDLMTLCNLIQARIESPVAAQTLDVTPYVPKCIGYLEFMLGNRILRNVTEGASRAHNGMPHGLPNVAKYFRWMHRSLCELQTAAAAREDKRLCYYRCAPYNKFSLAYTVPRTGWVNKGVERPENIMEHMYSCFLIAMLYLPEKTDNPQYSKSAILQTLLIHDLGETETGDIDRQAKALKQNYYDQEENRVMQELLFSGSYPHAVDLGGYYQGWSDWEKKSGINYDVAKDIDNLQTIFRFCQYYVQQPALFNDKDIAYWLCGLNTLRTQVVQDIAEFLVWDNPLFQELLERYSNGSER